MGSAAVAFWALTTLVLLATAVLVVVINYVAHKEYTEVIDRLRRDLLAARERNGVYITLENYNEMTRQLELNRQEIDEKLQRIKVLEKETAEKEVLCKELSISLEEAKGELVDSKNTLKLAAETVEEQLDRERQLTEKAHKILAAVSISNVDAQSLHDKLDRKRSVEQENSRISHDFRLEFNRKITQMRENTADFVSRSTRFMSDMRKALDESVQKRNKELSTLSDDLATMVNIQTNTLQVWNRKISDEIGTVQQNTQKLLQDARSIADTETNAVHNFLTEVFLPLTQNLQHQILRSKTENEGFARLVNEQTQRNLETVVTYARTQLEALKQLRENFGIPMQKVQEMSEKVQRAHKKKIQSYEKYNEELVSSLQKINEIVRNSEIKHQEMLSDEKRAVIEIEEYLRSLQQNTEKAYLLTNAGLETEEKRCRDLRNNIAIHTEDASDIVKGFLERASSVTSGIEECQDEVETVVRRAVSATEAAWSRQYSVFEQQLRQISENIRDVEKLHQDHAQQLTEHLHKSVRAHEAHLEEQRMTYSNIIHEQVISLEQQCTQVSDWGHSIDNRIQDRDKDVEEFLVELLRQEISAGTQAQRREFNYPTNLDNSTLTRILGRLHKIHEAAQYRNKLDQGILEELRLKRQESSISDIQAKNERSISNGVHILQSNENIKKKNSAPTVKPGTVNLLKSANLNHLKMQKRRVPNTKH